MPLFPPPRMRRLIPLAVFLIALPALAQREEPLPDLTPREFTIPGQLQVDLPELQRQPLRGFGPPPRPYVVPADRQTFIPAYGQDADALPADPLTPPPPPALARTTPRIGQLDAMAGRYFARRGRLTVNAGGFGLDAAYTGFSSYTPAESNPATLNATADDFTGRLSFTTGDALRTTLAFDAGYHDYTMLSAYEPMQSTAEPVAPLRTLTRFGGEVGLEAVPSRTVPYALRARFERAERSDRGIDLPSDPMALIVLNDRGESVVRLEGAVTPQRLAIEAASSFHTHTGATLNESFGASLTTYDAAAALRLPVGPGSARLGARVVGFASSVANGDASTTRIGPSVAFELPFGPTVRALARVETGIEDGSIYGLYRENPYLVPTPLIAPSVHGLDAVLGLDAQAGPAQFALRGGFRQSPTYRYFERSRSATLEGLYQVRYGEAITFHAALDATVHAPGGIILTGGGTFQSARLAATEGANARAVPYVAPLAGRLGIAVPFAETRGLIQGTLYAEGTRPAEAWASSDAPAWAALSIEAHYRFAGRFGLVARADRLAGTAERWPGFPQPPATLTAGLRAGW